MDTTRRNLFKCVLAMPFAAKAVCDTIIGPKLPQPAGLTLADKVHEAVGYRRGFEATRRISQDSKSANPRWANHVETITVGGKFSELPQHRHVVNL